METQTKLDLPETQETAYMVNEYPWGFRLKTKQRYWVESKKGFGMRLVTQTLNPKTDKWCKPKKSTYCVVMGLFLNELGHVKSWALSSGGWTKEEQIKEFEAFYNPLTDFQTRQIRYIRATIVMNEVTTWTIGGNSDKPRQTREEQQEIANKALTYGFAKVDGRI